MRSLAVLNLLITIMIGSCAYAMEFELGSKSKLGWESEDSNRWSVVGMNGSDSDSEESVEKKKKEKKEIERLKRIQTVGKLYLALNYKGVNLKKLVSRIELEVLIKYFKKFPPELPVFSMPFRERVWEKIEAEDGELYSKFAKGMISQMTGKDGEIENEQARKFLIYVVKVQAEDLSEKEKEISSLKSQLRAKQK